VTENVAASVHQRLLNRARAEERPFNELLQYFAMERFLYRLGRSPYRDQFVLKGALMFIIWQAPFPRATRDIDLLGRMPNDVDSVTTAVKDICHVPVSHDGLRFAPETVSGERIIEGAEYRGVRARFTGHLDRARISMQVDVGFGDPVTPHPIGIQWPTLLGFPAPELNGYTRESFVAEKVQAMVRLGEINSRMKDFFDVWLLADRTNFEGEILAWALRETFEQRRTAVPREPVALSGQFGQNPEKQTQWVAFLRRHRLTEKHGIPATLGDAIELIARFLRPAFEAIREGRRFDDRWPPGGPWVASWQP